MEHESRHYSHPSSESEDAMPIIPATAAHARLPQQKSNPLSANSVQEREPKPSLLMSVLHTLMLFVFALLAAVLIRTYVGEPYYVPTGSMLETIQLNDRVWGEKLSYRSREPEVGDVVVFPDPADAAVMLIKRVVAKGGQTVDFVDGKLVVDGKVMDEPYTLGKPSEPLSMHADTLIETLNYPYKIPEGSLWVMGDNRTNSLDSRYFGAVETGVIKARAVMIFWPYADWKLL